MSKARSNRKLLAGITAGVLLQATVMCTAVGAASDSDDQWEFEATIYLWTPEIDTTTQGGADATGGGAHGRGAL